MSVKIALAGNPNSGKTTLFNTLTGSNQYVGNWPGVTVEKKEGKYRGDKEVIIQDLPGIYSLSPYTLEEVVSRTYLVTEKPDAILNIIDGTNIERNLYLTTQLMELGIPVVIAINMMDLVRKNGDSIDTGKISKELGCPVIEISALKNESVDKVIQAAVSAARSGLAPEAPSVMTGNVKNAIGQIQSALSGKVSDSLSYWYAVKIFERDEKVIQESAVSSAAASCESIIAAVEEQEDDDAESIITNQRYNFISGIVEKSVVKKAEKHSLTVSDKVDRIVTNRILGIPIFLVIIFSIYAIAMGGWTVSIGTAATDWANDVLFGEIVPGLFDTLLLDVFHVAEGGVIYGLVQDGIVAGIGAVLGFVPQMLVLFFFLAILEDIGYMARVAFVMDRLFRQFGLSGKSFIPMLVATGCGVPGIMASRTIEQDRDRKMTIMTTGFMPCGAKLPIIGLIAGAVFGGSPYIATSAYLIGMASIIISGIMLKKFKMFAGEPAPFVMELPPYHIPSASGVLRATWERGWSFIKRAGSVIVISSIILWFLQAFGIENGAFGLVEEQDNSLLAVIGSSICWIFAPLGFGNWRATVATITGLIAKENVVGTFGVLYHFAGELSEEGEEIWANVAADYTPIAAFSFMCFNLLCAPCFAAMGAIKREMNNTKWTLGAIGYMCLWAYVVAMIVYNVIGLAFGVGFSLWTIVGLALPAGVLYLLFRKGYQPEKGVRGLTSVEANR